MIGELTIGMRIRTRRRRLGLTQDEMEKRTGLDQAYLSRVERGIIKRPSVDVAVIIARALGCTVEDLAGGNATSLLPAA